MSMKWVRCLNHILQHTPSETPSESPTTATLTVRLVRPSIYQGYILMTTSRSRQ